MDITYDFATNLNLLNEPADSDFEKGISVSHLKECIDTDKINELRYFNEIVSLKDSIQSVFNSNYKMNAIESKELNALNDKISEFLSSNFDKFSENSKDYYYIKLTSAFQSIHFMISEKMYVQLALVISETTLGLTIFITLLFKLFKLAFGW